MPDSRIAPLASRLSRLVPRPPCRHTPEPGHATAERVRGDVGRGPGGLNYPTRDRLEANRQTLVKGRAGLVSGLLAPGTDLDLWQALERVQRLRRGLRRCAAWPGSPSGSASCQGSRHLQLASCHVR